MTEPKRCVDCDPGAPLRRVTSGRTVKTYRCFTHTRQRKAFEKNRSRAAHLWSKYKMTVEEYEELKAEQGGTCYLCRIANGSSKALAVDHDHKCCPGKTTCGKCVRGLLCGPCNKIVGIAEMVGRRFGLDPWHYFELAVGYLKRPPARDLVRKWGKL